jgi:hypothetical protein
LIPIVFVVWRGDPTEAAQPHKRPALDADDMAGQTLMRWGGARLRDGLHNGTPRAGQLLVVVRTRHRTPRTVEDVLTSEMKEVLSYCHDYDSYTSSNIDPVR